MSNTERKLTHFHTKRNTKKQHKKKNTKKEKQLVSIKTPIIINNNTHTNSSLTHQLNNINQLPATRLSTFLFEAMKLAISYLSLISPLLVQEASSFLSVELRQHDITTANRKIGLASFQLYAKGGTKKKKNVETKASTGGGFGKVVAPSKSKPKQVEDDDCAAFPALDTKVKETLIPSHVSYSENSQELPPEIYDRLAQIYGFKNFNYPVGWVDEDNNDDTSADESPLSFDELLSADSSSTSSKSTEISDLLKSEVKSSKIGNDFSDLMTSVTGGESIESNKTEKDDSSKHCQIDVSNLQPFKKFRVLHVDPMVLAVDDFFTPEECDNYVNLCKAPKKRTSSNDMPMMSRSKTVGKDSLAKAQRTSTTWFHHFKSVPELVAKATRLLGLDTIDRWEEPQTVRYQQSEKFTWHLDALAPSDNLNDTGGQRVATLLVYLTDIGEGNGGSTQFRDLGGEDEEYLKVQPKKGSALLFFPAAGGIPSTPFDIRTLHAGEALSAEATEEKWIAQMWLRENSKYSPTAPPGNTHLAAADVINTFCDTAIN